MNTLGVKEDVSDTLVYYAHPYSSWKKESNERHNRLVRRFIAKGKRISDYGLDAIASGVIFFLV